MDIKMPEFYEDKTAKVTKIDVKVGDTVAAWAPLMTIESSKGAEVIKSKKAGVVTALNVEVGGSYACGSVVAVVEEGAPAPKVEEKPVVAEELLEVKVPVFYDDKGAKVGKISVKEGDEVTAWQELMTIETSKGVEPVKAKKAGVVKTLNAKEGETYESGTVIAVISVGAKAEAKKEETVIEQKPAETIEIKMPMFYDDKTAKIGKLSVQVGDVVKAWQELMVIENSKGTEPVKTKKAGTVVELNVVEGESYESGAVLAVVALGDAPVAVEKKEETKPVEKTEEAADILILGAGTGGYMAAIMAAKKGRKVVIVEKNELGGTCLNVGCIPTKTLIASSSRYKSVLEANEFGIKVEGTVTPDMAAIIDRKDRVVKRLVNGVNYLMNKNQITVVKGTASFVDNSHVKVVSDTEKVYSFNECIIATGSVVAMPPVAGIDGPNVLDSTKALNLKELPKAITIVGGGVIGMEFAFLYKNLGVDVTVVEFLPKLLATLDPDISDMITEMAADKGIRVETNAKVVSLTDTVNGQVITSFEKDGKTQFAVADKVLVATGRKSNTEGLGLENTTIEMNDRGRGIKVDDHMKTNVDHIYAVGDVNNRIQLAHAASEQGIIAVENILGEEKTFDVNLVPSVIFTDPEIASVGLNKTQCEKMGIAYKEGIFHFSANGKALTMGESKGFARLLKNEQNEIIGGTVIGADASTLIAIIAEAVTNKLTDEQFTKTIYAHPTTAEVVHEAALDLSIGAFNE